MSLPGLGPSPTQLHWLVNWRSRYCSMQLTSCHAASALLLPAAYSCRQPFMKISQQHNVNVCNVSCICLASALRTHHARLTRGPPPCTFLHSTSRASKSVRLAGIAKGQRDEGLCPGPPGPAAQHQRSFPPKPEPAARAPGVLPLPLLCVL